MELFQYQWVDMFATKGIKYLLVLAFWFSIFPFWRTLLGPVRVGRRAIERVVSGLKEWFDFPPYLYYHQGHTWVRVDEKGTVKVGLDDFAQKLLGQPDTLELPEIGSRLRQGDIAWRLKIGGKVIEMLSPVNGVVTAVNVKVLEDPSILNRDPYGEGWLLKVRAEGLKFDLRNLFKGEVLKGWVEATLEKLRTMIGTELGLMYQDGGLPVSGFIRQIAPNDWDKIVREFLVPET